MKRLALALSLLTCLLARNPARADGILVLVDSLANSPSGGAQGAVMDARNVGPLFDLMNRSMATGKQVTISNTGGTATLPVWTMTELRDSVSATATNPKYQYSLIVCLAATDNSYLFNTNNRTIPQLSLAANRPKVPVMYISEVSFLHNYVGDDTLGAVGAYIQTPDSVMLTSPAGFAFPSKVGFVKRSSGASGAYVTPVLWVAGIGCSKADPDGYCGTSATASDSMAAWFYNPPIVSTRTGLASANGYGVIHWESSLVNSGNVTNYATGPLAAVAVGMMARLAPTLFRFPAQHIALDIDDGMKRYAPFSSQTEMADALAGLDSLGVWKIPYTYGVEVDSMTAAETGYASRFAFENQTVRRYGMGKYTVHCHRGFSAAQGGSAAGVADTSLASASGGVYTDIFGSGCQRYCFGTSGATRDQSVYSLLSGATIKLIRQAGDPGIVSREVMPPTDDYSTKFIGQSNNANATFDSVAYAIALAGASVGHGYRVVRTQYQANQYQFNIGTNTGGLGYGFNYFLPAINTIGAALISPVTVGYRGLLFAPSMYLWGTTNDSVSTQSFGTMRGAANALLGQAMGFNRNYDVSTANEAASANALAYRGSAHPVIFVTHIANWREATRGSKIYGGGRPGWENVRMMYAAMQAAKWAAQQANTSSTTYFREGPIQWVWADQITERDIR